MGENSTSVSSGRRPKRISTLPPARRRRQLDLLDEIFPFRLLIDIE
jgi:hypothetical protein